MIKAVILNRVANPRHEKKLRDSIEHYCGIPVIGAIPKLDQQHFPERHLGLVPTFEHDWAIDAIDAIAKVAEQHLDLNAILRISQQAPLLKPEDGGQKTEDRGQMSEFRSQRLGNQSFYQKSRIHHRVSYVKGTETSGQELATSRQQPVSSERHPAPRIGIIRDSAFQFYYPENIDALSGGGAEIVFISPLRDRNLQKIDALYIGGGFPETHAQHLADNVSFSRQLKALADDGLPIYAECGGLMYLGEKLVLKGNAYPMVGILPVAFDFYKKPQGHGYTIVAVESQNPYFDVGTEIRGHEFHYSRVLDWTGNDNDLVFHMKRGVGITKDRDGIVYKNVLATYTHVHALGTPGWAGALIRNAVKFKDSR